MAINARFWEHVNGDYVKITLRPEQQLTHKRFKRTEEGWRFECDTWSFVNGMVINDHGSAEKDCDGWMSHYDEYRCHLTQLKAKNNDYVFCVQCKNFASDHWTNGKRLECIDVKHANAGLQLKRNPATPAWIHSESAQRDYAAERMGY